MGIEQIGATDFRVQSESRPDVQHSVDLEYRERKNEKPYPVCTCEAFIARRQKTCKHIKAVKEHLRALAYRQRQAAVDEGIA